MSKLMGFWTNRRMVMIVGVALTGIALHLILRYGVHSDGGGVIDADSSQVRRSL